MEMEIKIKKKTNWITLIILCIYELFILFFMFLFSYITIIEITQDRLFSDLIIASFFLIFLGVFLLDKILWQIFGQEIIIMDKEKLIVQKKGKIFTKRNIIYLFEIDNIEQKDYKTTFSTLFFKIMGMRGGKICIKYLEKNVYVGQSLSNSEALEYTKIMNKILRTSLKIDKN
jgi:hypothetical protein